MLRLVLLAFVPLLLNAQVKINEVLFYTDPTATEPLQTHQWLELFNSGADPVDLSGWALTAADPAATARPLPAVTLPAGAYLVVHFASGLDRLDFAGNSGDFYTGDSSAFWNVDVGEAALYSPDGIVDFINWRISTATYVPGQAHDDAVAAGTWTAGAVLIHDRIGLERMEVLRTLEAGDSIGRNPDSLDTNSVSDFNAHGGGSAMGPTPGLQNLGAAPIAPPDSPENTSAKTAPARKKWTIMLFSNGDNSLESWEVTKICRLQQAGGSTADVNFVVQLDLKSLKDPVTHQDTTYRGLVSAPRAPVDCKLSYTGPANNPFFDPARLTLINPGLTDIGERDMGDPLELAAFITWAQAYYPADHYGLVLASHGLGWKGLGPDETFHNADTLGMSGLREHKDSLYMGELSHALALAGNHFDWIVFDACLMASVEVAYQISDYADYMLASEEITWADTFRAAEMAQYFTQHPDSTGLAAITDMYDQTKAYAESKTQSAGPYTVSVVRLSQVPKLINRIGDWADLLTPAMKLFFGRQLPDDNAQILTKKALEQTERFTDKNFIDLYDFGTNMLLQGLPLDCMTNPVPDIQNLLDKNKKNVVILESHGTQHPRAHGLHIYFPRRRMVDIPTAFLFAGADQHRDQRFQGYYFDNDFLDQPYDLPSARLEDGYSPFAHYGVNVDQLPVRARDPETGDSISNWPLPQSPGFLFPPHTNWDRFLNAYYHPAAEVTIQPVTVNGVTIRPTQTGGGTCANSMDNIQVPLGTEVTFSAAGSSDADMPTGNVPQFFFWDKDDQVGCAICTPKPFTVDPGVPAHNAVQNMDADRDKQDSQTDQRDGIGVTFKRTCDRLTPPIVVTLMPWDDNHRFAFHNTWPTAEYVHPQSGLHQAKMTCTPLTVGGVPVNGVADLTFTVMSDPYVSAPFVGLINGTLTFTINGVTMSVTGDRPQLPNGSGTFDAATRTFKATIVATGRIAGFQGVETKWNLLFAADGKSIASGSTYQVGTNGNLNGEDKPITYAVTGTVRTR